MSSTKNQIIYNEINQLKKLSIDSSNIDRLNKVRQSSTYFIDYSDSKHLHAPLTEYNSDSICEFRKNMSDLWSNDKELCLAIPIILSAYEKTKKTNVSQVKEVDLYNYMM